mmetsp:Transcript_2258/g.7562  ORF Transcript_2258/g.7562 Transcript_2258/m.7562 type:complete len:213 (+) Transcript_2258:776-1414(+)
MRRPSRMHRRRLRFEGLRLRLRRREGSVRRDVRGLPRAGRLGKLPRVVGVRWLLPVADRHCDVVGQYGRRRRRPPRSVVLGGAGPRDLQHGSQPRGVGKFRRHHGRWCHVLGDSVPLPSLERAHLRRRTCRRRNAHRARQRGRRPPGDRRHVRSDRRRRRQRVPEVHQVRAGARTQGRRARRSGRRRRPDVLRRDLRRRLLPVQGVPHDAAV